MSLNWKGLHFPSNALRGKGVKAGDFGRSGHFAEKWSAWGLFQLVKVNSLKQQAVETEKHSWGGVGLRNFLNEHI